MGFQMLLTGNPSAAADNILDVFVTTARGQDFSTDGVSAFQFASKKLTSTDEIVAALLIRDVTGKGCDDATW